MSHYTLSDIAAQLGARFDGEANPDLRIDKMSSLANAQPGSISFLLSPSYQSYLPTTQASVVIVPEGFESPVGAHYVPLYMADPNVGYAKLATLFTKRLSVVQGIHASALVGENCQIAESASIGPRCVIGDGVVIGANTVIRSGAVIDADCVIGEDCLIYPNVTLYHGVRIGDRVVIHSGAVLGADGFGMIMDNGAWQKIPQLGGVWIGNDVEVGANTTIDRGAIDDTIIEDGVKMDNLIMIAHNVRIGAHTAIAGCVGIAGSTTIGKYCLIGGATGIADHLTICDQVIFTGNCFVTKSIDQPGVYSSGLPAQPREKWQRSVVQFRRLGDTVARIKKLERFADELSENS